MPRIYMVRHGRIASEPLDPTDPELGADGCSQARAVARELSARLPAKAVLAHPTDAVMFSHFVPINVLVGHALHTEQVAVFRPDNGSVTLFETRARRIHLLERGCEQLIR
jgi:broad specificity phosphatase PhoE